MLHLFRHNNFSKGLIIIVDDPHISTPPIFTVKGIVVRYDHIIIPRRFAQRIYEINDPLLPRKTWKSISND